MKRKSYVFIKTASREIMIVSLRDGTRRLVAIKSTEGGSRGKIAGILYKKSA